MIDELTARLEAAGFTLGERRRILLTLAGATIPTAGRLRAARAVDLARELLAEGRATAEIAPLLRHRFGISTATAYRRIAAALSECAPSEKTSGDTTPSP